MSAIEVDVCVAGGGIAGMISAISFASLGYKTVCVDPSPPVTDQLAKNADMRSTAFLQPAKKLLTEIGLWELVEAYAAPLQIMKIIDAGGSEPVVRTQSEFNSSDISDQPFGWNFPNWLLRRECLKRISQLKSLTFETGVSVVEVMTRTDSATVSLSNNEQIKAKLLIAADGRTSHVREALGIQSKTIRYGQHALAFTVTHSIPHKNISTEIHRTGGPFTMVPLPDHNGLPASAVVWMERSSEAFRLQNVDTSTFMDAINTRSCSILGPLTLNSPRTIWPIISQYSQTMSGQRTALVAEAAHVVPPIGAQGLNMSLADIRALYDLAKTYPNDIGSTKMQSDYHSARHTDIRTRVMGIDALNRASMVSSRPLRDMRALGLNIIYGFSPIRKTLMKIGLGARN
ncbi:UbiH/UbiF family hydroxylase [Lentibacter sp.]|uniref:UbiH/UbiF family hydroxylase n=1 Tax=Lentibacter sp. TaxID=2024994 RepID=UPI003F6A2B1B